MNYRLQVHKINARYKQVFFFSHFVSWLFNFSAVEVQRYKAFIYVSMPQNYICFLK